MARQQIDAELNSDSLDRGTSRLTEAIDAGREARDVNKKRGGFTGDVVRFVKRNSEKLGVSSFGALGERGFKISGIVGATAGLLALDKAAEAAKRMFQGQSIKDAIASQIKEIIPPFLRDTIPEILDELNRRRRLEEEAARGAEVFDRDLENRLKNNPEIRRKAAQEWVDFWDGARGKERREKEANGVSY